MLADGVAVLGGDVRPTGVVDLNAPVVAAGGPVAAVESSPVPPVRAVPALTPAQLRAAARREKLARLDAGHGNPRDVIAAAAKRHQAALTLE